MQTLKSSIKKSYLFLVAISFSAVQVSAQTTQFDFNSTATLTTATVGTNALSVGTLAQSTNGFAGHGNIDLEIAGASYKQNDIYMEWDYVNREGNANFFELDDLEITMVGRNISIQYRNTTAGSVKSYSNITTLTNGTTYSLSFSYDAATGIAELKNGSTSLWTTPLADRGANNLVWNSGTTSAFVGNGMDGSGSTSGTLDAFRIWANMSLPVDFISVSANRLNDVISVNWATASELNNERFIIQRSYDGREFDDIGTVMGAGNSFNILNYKFEDNLVSLTSNDIFYRIKQIDYDGSNDYSQVVKVAVDKENSIRVYPNPATTGEVQVEGWHEGVVTKLYGQQGRLILETTRGDIMLTDLESGFYQVVFYDEDTRQHSTQKLIVH